MKADYKCRRFLFSAKFFTRTVNKIARDAVGVFRQNILFTSTHSDIKIESNSGQYMFGFNNQKANLKKKKYNIFVLNNQKANL